MTQDNAITVLVAVIASLPPTLVAWAALRTSKANAVKSDTIIEKANEIHILTNSNLSKVTSLLEVANTKIAGQKDVITALKEKPV